MLGITITASPIGLFFAFLGGVISILSPCVLPILPGFAGLVSSASIEEIENDKKLLPKVVRMCVLFSVGFSFVYIVIGLTTTQLSQTFLDNSELATRVGGFFLIFFALVLLVNQLTDFKLFSGEKRPFLKSGITDSGAVVTGAAFGFGWSPCIGPILGGVLAYASTEHAISARVAIILSYCIGLCFAMSFIIYSGFKYKRFNSFIRRNVNIFVWISILTMAFFGLLLAMNQFTWLTAELSQFMDMIGLDGLVTIG